MNKKSSFFLLWLIAAMLNDTIVAQVNTYDQFTIVINDICMIKSNTTPSPASLTLSTSVAGSAVSPVSNSNTYLKVTSITPIGETRKVTAIIYNGTVPAGTILKLISAACSGINSSGDLGTVISPAITLNKTANQTIIEDIGSCYTGTALTDGYQLTYTWQPDETNYYLINATSGATSLVISFTIMSVN